LLLGLAWLAGYTAFTLLFQQEVGWGDVIQL
jgi:hypothetical protein